MKMALTASLLVLGLAACAPVSQPQAGIQWDDMPYVQAVSVSPNAFIRMGK